MRLDMGGVTIETGGQVVESEFKIGDPRIILEYLRKSVYSNPKRIICQEIMSNARDAHREVGKDDVAIHVKLPTKLNPNWSCQDFGPGINPTRMREVFIQFGNSTKRGTGVHATDDGTRMTGGYGIGAKVPWAYTDSFTIVTRAVEDGLVVERTYVAVIGEDRKNKLMEFENSKRICDQSESTGTTIIVPVKPNDFAYFHQYSIEITEYWNVKPVFTPDSCYQIQPKTIIYSGSDWRMYRSKNDNRSVIALVDGIPYPISYSSIDNVDHKIQSLFNTELSIDFGVGEMSVALSREILQYDVHTQKVIKDKLHNIVNEITTQIHGSMKTIDNLWDAKVFWINNVAQLGFERIIGYSCNWTDPVSKEVVEINNDHFGLYPSRFGVKLFARTPQYGRGRKNRNNDVVYVHDQTILYTNDNLERVSQYKIDEIFKQNPNIESVQVSWLKCNMDEKDEFLKKPENEKVHKLLKSLTKHDLSDIQLPKLPPAPRNPKPKGKVSCGKYINGQTRLIPTTIDLSTVNPDEYVVVETCIYMPQHIDTIVLDSYVGVCEYLVKNKLLDKPRKILGVNKSDFRKFKSFMPIGVYMKNEMLPLVKQIYAQEQEKIDYVNECGEMFHYGYHSYSENNTIQDLHRLVYKKFESEIFSLTFTDFMKEYDNYLETKANIDLVDYRTFIEACNETVPKTQNVMIERAKNLHQRFKELFKFFYLTYFNLQNTEIAKHFVQYVNNIGK